MAGAANVLRASRVVWYTSCMTTTTILVLLAIAWLIIAPAAALVLGRFLRGLDRERRDIEPDDFLD